MHLPLVRVSRIVSFACAAAVALAAIIVLAGWALAPAITALGAGGVPMNSLTAVRLLLLAAGLLFVLPTPHGRVEGVAGATCAGIALALAAAPVSRMAPNTAFITAATAIGILLLDVEIHGRRPAQFVILVSLPLTFVVQIGYLFRITELEGWGTSIPTARATVIALGMLQLAIAAGRVEHGITRIFVARGPGGVTARRLFPAVIIAPVVIGYVRLIGQRRGVYGPELGVVLFTIAMVVLFAILVWTTAQKVHAVDAARAEIDLRLQTLIRHVPLGIVVLDLDGRVQLCNEAFVELFHYPVHELMGHRLDELIAPAEDGGETASLTARGFAGESVRRTTVRRRRDGSLIDVELYVVPLAMEGQAIGTYGVYRDLQSGARRARI